MDSSSGCHKGGPFKITVSSKIRVEDLRVVIRVSKKGKREKTSSDDSLPTSIKEVDACETPGFPKSTGINCRHRILSLFNVLVPFPFPLLECWISVHQSMFSSTVSSLLFNLVRLH